MWVPRDGVSFTPEIGPRGERDDSRLNDYGIYSSGTPPFSVLLYLTSQVEVDAGREPERKGTRVRPSSLERGGGRGKTDPVDLYPLYPFLCPCHPGFVLVPSLHPRPAPRFLSRSHHHPPP